MQGEEAVVRYMVGTICIVEKFLRIMPWCEERRWLEGGLCWFTSYGVVIWDRMSQFGESFTVNSSRNC